MQLNLPLAETNLATVPIFDIPATPPRDHFDRLTSLATRVFNVPVVVITLINPKQCWFKFASDLHLENFESMLAFCTHLTEIREQSLVVPDTYQDTRFVNTPLVSGVPHFRFYAGIPLNNKKGSRLGTLCLLDTKPRTLSSSQLETLDELAEMVVAQLEERQHVDQLAIRLEEQQQLLDGIFNTLSAEKVVLDKNGLIRYASRSWEEFARHNGGDLARCGVGANYLEVCRKAIRQDPAVSQILAGIETVMTGRANEYSTEYEQPTPGGNYWFSMHVDPLPPEVGGVIITHIDVTKRKLAEKQREESFRLFRALIEYSSEMITMTSRTGEVLYQSPSVARLMGYSESELAGRNSFEMVHPDDLAGLIAQQKTLVARPDLVHRNEFRFRHKDGTWHYMETSAQNLLEESGINGIIVNGHDITERKKVELALRESQERLNFALSAAGVGIWEYEVQSGRVSLSEQVEAMLGMEPTSFDGTFETFVNMTLPYHRERLILRVQEALERGGDYHIEYQVKRTDGKVVWLEGQGQAYLDEAGKPLKLSGVVQDITRRKETEAALLVSETRFTAFMEHSPAAAFILDDQANILYVNKAYRHIFETQEELIGRNCATLFPAELNERHRTHDREVLEKQVVVLETESWQKQDGRPGHFLGYKFPITEASGRKLVGGVGIDISEQKAAQEALARSEAQLRQSQKMEAVGQLAGGVAHDFNNLLTAITGYSELVLMQLSEAEPLYADVKEILGAANRATSLTRQLLAFSRQQVLKPAVLDLNQVVGEMERMLRRLIGENIELITRPGERLAAVRADQGQLEQVIVNLAVNARDAMPEVGKLIFETASIELDQEYKAYHPYIAPGSYVRLAVSDTGCGMNETIRNRIFEPFFTTKERGRGTGLGLSTVYGIIKQSGGYIEVYSEEGLGTTFKIYLPAVTSSQEAYIPAQVPVYGAGTAKLQDRQATVLVVEDEEGVRNLGARVLEQSGYRVLVAGSGVEALSIAKQNNGRIDLLLTDVVMPKLSGPALSKLLAQSQPGIKILYMSGYTDGLLAENEEVLTGKVVSEQLIQKPFTPQSLLQKVRQTLEDCFNSATDGYD